MFLFSFIAGFSQTTNTLIQDGSGTLLPTAVAYCPGDSFDLKVNADAASTDSYTATKETTSFNAGSNEIIFDTTDANIFSRPVDIGFDFSFYGQTYKKVVVGRNGRLVFTNDSRIDDLHDTDMYKDRTFSGINGYNGYAELASEDYNKVFKNDENAELNLAQIFFGYTDLYFSSSYVDKTLYRFSKNYSHGGRKGLLISIQQMIRTNGTGGFSGNSYYGYVFLSTTGEVIIRVDQKTDNTYNAILGMQDETGKKYFVPDHSSGGNYNNGKWKSEGIAWVFKANLKPVSKIEWFVDGNTTPVGKGSQISFKPENLQNLKVIISYQDGTTAESTVNFSPYVKPEISSVAQTGCAAGEKLQVENPVSGITYYWYKDGKAYGTTGTSVIANATGKYTVKPDDCNAAVSDEIAISVKSDIVPIGFEDNTTFSKCDNENAASKTFRLTDLVGYQPGNGYTVQFWDENGSVVASAANDYEFTVSSGMPVTLTLKVSSTASDCSDSKKFVIDYLSFPKNETKTKKLCFGTDLYTVEEFKTDFPQYAGFDIDFTTNVNPQTQNPITVKLSKKEYSCTATLTLNFEFYEEIKVRNYSQFPEHCSSKTEYFDLTETKKELEYDDVKVSFYKNYDKDSKTFSNLIGNLSYRGSGTVYIKLENSNGCTYLGDPPTLDLIIYEKPKLIKNTPEIKYSECGSSNFDLTTNIQNYIGQWNHYSEIRYYNGNNEQLTTSEWEQYNPQTEGNPYMVFVYNQTDNLECSDIIQFNLIKKVKPTVQKRSIMICSETTYSKADFLNQILDDPALEVTLSDGSALPNSFDLSNLPLDVEILIKNTTTGCVSDPVTVTFDKGTPTVLNNGSITKFVCDDDFDGFTTINLTKYLENLTSDNSASAQYFTDENLQHIINDPANFINSSRKQDIYVSIQSAGYCPSTGVLHLTVNTPTKSTTLKDTYYICYGDNIVVNAGKENTTFQWEGGSAGQSGSEWIYTDAGDYSVTLTNAEGCSYTHKFTISADHQPEIRQIIQTNDRIEVHAEGGSGNYEYSFDGGATWQLSNIFPNPVKDTYTIQARSVLPDGSTCNGAPKSIYTIRISNVITPNDDGKNDTWIIKNLRKMSDISVVISDRYGRTVYSAESGADYTTYPGGRSSSGNADDFVWDGKVNGRSLSTDTYWYVVKWYNPASLKNEIRTGWILLKNRD